jgi:uncharacterized protein (TIGR00369 family)
LIPTPTMEFSHDDISASNRNTLYETIGIEVIEAAKGRARCVFRPKPAVCWPFPGQPHGGILATLMDTTMAWAVNTLVESGQNCATISMEVQFTQRALGGEFICEGWVAFQAGRMAYTRAEVRNSTGGLFAAAQAAFRVIKVST